MIPAMIASLRYFLGWLVSVFRSREDLVLENLALRRQLLALHAQQPHRRRTEACQQRGPRLDFPYGCRESDLGSTAHSRRTAQAGFRALGEECLAMDPASSERSRFREAMADVPQKPSRGNCCNGFLHRPNAHVWCSVLLFRHRPRPTEDPAFQCDAKSHCTLGCTAIATMPHAA